MAGERDRWRGRVGWCELPKRVRRDVIKHARKGVAYPDRDVADKALRWAHTVLGPPDDRRRVSVWERVGFAIEVIMTSPGSNVGMDILDGRERYDTWPWVRHVAKQIERANT